MEQEKNKKIELSDAQQNPRLALPEDFIVTHELPFGGECGDSPAEHRQLLNESSRMNSKSPLTGVSAQAADPLGRQLVGKAPKSLNPSAIRKSVRKTDKS